MVSFAQPRDQNVRADTDLSHTGALSERQAMDAKEIHSQQANTSSVDQAGASENSPPCCFGAITEAAISIYK